MSIIKPLPDQYGAYYKKYIDLVEGDPIEHLRKQKEVFSDQIKNNNSILDYAYDEGKWTLRELYMHIIETELIFAYRALRISRGDKESLHGFDQDIYIKNNDLSHVSGDQLIALFESNRNMILSLYDTFTPQQIDQAGTASGYPLGVGAIPYILAGHYIHHSYIINERYL